MNHSEQMLDLKKRMTRLGLSTNAAVRQLIVADRVKQEIKRKDEMSMGASPAVDESLATTMRRRFHTQSAASTKSATQQRRRFSVGITPEQTTNAIYTAQHHSAATNNRPINDIPKRRKTAQHAVATLLSHRRQSLWGASSIHEDEGCLNKSFRRRSTAKLIADLPLQAVHDKKELCQKHVMQAEKRNEDLRKTIQDFYEDLEYNLPPSNQQRRQSLFQQSFSFASRLKPHQQIVVPSRRKRRSFSMDDAAFAAALEEIKKTDGECSTFQRESEIEHTCTRTNNRFRDSDQILGSPTISKLQAVGHHLPQTGDAKMVTPDEREPPTIFDLPSNNSTSEPHKRHIEDTEPSKGILLVFFPKSPRSRSRSPVNTPYRSPRKGSTRKVQHDTCDDLYRSLSRYTGNLTPASTAKVIVKPRSSPSRSGTVGSTIETSSNHSSNNRSRNLSSHRKIPSPAL